MTSSLKVLFLSLIWTGLILSLGIFSGWVTISDPAPWLIHPALFIYKYLGLSVVPFGVLFFLYFHCITRFRSLLNQQEQLSPDTLETKLSYNDMLHRRITNSFLGVGVIWTAIGILFALLSVYQDGQADNIDAWTLYERLTNGGLVLALSTTIFGGVCGYLLDLLSCFCFGENLVKAKVQIRNRRRAERDG